MFNFKSVTIGPFMQEPAKKPLIFNHTNLARTASFVDVQMHSVALLSKAMDAREVNIVI